MSGKHEICNVALGLLGASPIQSFADASVEAEGCRNFYEMAVRAVLEDHPWNFAEKTFELAADATAYRPDFDFSYTLPQDCVVPRGLLDAHGRPSLCVFKRSGSRICTNQDGGWLIYTSRAPEQLFSGLFRMALAKHLAYLLAGLLTESEGKVQTWYQAYREELAVARSRDSQTDFGEQIDTTALIRVHAG